MVLVVLSVHLFINIPSLLAQVAETIKAVGFKDQLDSMKGPRPAISPEMAAVRDADRLDAIGAVGIGRAFAFGGAKNRPLHDPNVSPQLNMTKAEYMAQKDNPLANPTINHFDEKLFLLKDLMCTDEGRAIAQKRHEYMVGFVQRFKDEWEGYC